MDLIQICKEAHENASKNALNLLFHRTKWRFGLWSLHSWRSTHMSSAFVLCSSGVSRWIFKLLSVLWKFTAEVCNNEALKNNEQRIWMFLLHVHFVVIQAWSGGVLKTRPESRKSPMLNITVYSLRKWSLNEGHMIFFQHCYICAPTFVSVEADSTSSHLPCQLHVVDESHHFCSWCSDCHDFLMIQIDNAADIEHDRYEKHWPKWERTRWEGDKNAKMDLGE